MKRRVEFPGEKKKNFEGATILPDEPGNVEKKKNISLKRTSDVSIGRALDNVLPNVYLCVCCILVGIPAEDIPLKPEIREAHNENDAQKIYVISVLHDLIPLVTKRKKR